MALSVGTLDRSLRASDLTACFVLVFVGAAIVVAAGLFVIWRERQLGLQRARAAEGPPTAT